MILLNDVARISVLRFTAGPLDCYRNNSEIVIYQLQSATFIWRDWLKTNIANIFFFSIFEIETRQKKIVSDLLEFAARASHKCAGRQVEKAQRATVRRSQTVKWIKYMNEQQNEPNTNKVKSILSIWCLISRLTSRNQRHRLSVRCRHVVLGSEYNIETNVLFCARVTSNTKHMYTMIARATFFISSSSSFAVFFFLLFVNVWRGEAKLKILHIEQLIRYGQKTSSIDLKWNSVFDTSESIKSLKRI